MANKMPSWLSPRVSDLLPIPEATVFGRLGAAIKKARMTEEEVHAEAVKRGKARAAALTPEQRSAISSKAALAMHAKFGRERWVEVCKRAGAASQASRSATYKKRLGNMVGKRGNAARWGVPGVDPELRITARQLKLLQHLLANPDGAQAKELLAASGYGGDTMMNLAIRRLVQRKMVRRHKIPGEGPGFYNFITRVGKRLLIRIAESQAKA